MLKAEWLRLVNTFRPTIGDWSVFFVPAHPAKGEPCNGVLDSVAKNGSKARFGDTASHNLKLFFLGTVLQG
jgi:hypothetical protein